MRRAGFRWRTFGMLTLMMGLFVAFAPVSAEGDANATATSERPEHATNEESGRKLISSSSSRVTFFPDENRNPVLAREEVLTGPNTGRVEEQGCADCVIDHEGYTLILEVSVYEQENASYPISYLFQGHFKWLDRPVSIPNWWDKDSVTLEWNGEPALTWHGLNGHYENGNAIQWTTRDEGLGQRVMMDFPEWDGLSRVSEGFASGSVVKPKSEGLAGNVVFTYRLAGDEWQAATYSGFEY
ncbi:MAG TPA: hypothetical protein VFS96_07015 [Nitrolancea sp.]|nr:hypothetical protein [Nitrolancea sp.]